MTTRRSTLRILGAALVSRSLVGRAQPANRVPTIGVLAAGSPHPQVPAPIHAFREALRGLGYIEGENLRIEYRWAEGNPGRLPALAADLVRSNVEVIVASGDAAVRAARVATTTIPIVMATSGDAVGAGFAASLARPGGNITGMTAITPELSAKRLQLLQGLVPRVTRVSILWNPSDPVHALDWRETQGAARSLGLALQSVEFRATADIDKALAAFANAPPETLIVFNAAETVERRTQLLDAAARQRIPAMYDASEWVDAGGLVSYGVTHAALFRRSAAFVDRILKGAKPADLPIEQPTTFLLALNLRTAKALGISIPQALLLRADKVIQ